MSNTDNIKMDKCKIQSIRDSMLKSKSLDDKRIKEIRKEIEVLEKQMKIQQMISQLKTSYVITRCLAGAKVNVRWICMGKVSMFKATSMARNTARLVSDTYPLNHFDVIVAIKHYVKVKDTIRK